MRSHSKVRKLITVLKKCNGKTVIGDGSAGISPKVSKILAYGGLLALTDESRLSAMPKDLPVYFMSGDHDPVGQMGAGVRQVAEQFKKAGMENVTVKLYQDARHELFNELNRDEVTADLIAWLANQTK